MTISLTYNGTVTSQFKLTVRKPGTPRLIDGYPSDVAVLTGFRTRYLFQLLDQFGLEVPFNLPINEAFSAWASDWSGEQWPVPEPNGFMSTVINNVSHAFSDTYAYIFPFGFPSPVNPTDPDADDKVQHATQYYRAGSTTVGRGILFKQQVLQFYRGKARQE